MPAISESSIPVIGYTGKLLGRLDWPDARLCGSLEWALAPGVRRKVRVGWAVVNGAIDRAVILHRGQALSDMPRGFRRIDN